MPKKSAPKTKPAKAVKSAAPKTKPAAAVAPGVDARDYTAPKSGHPAGDRDFTASKSSH